MRLASFGANFDFGGRQPLTAEFVQTSERKRSGQAYENDSTPRSAGLKGACQRRFASRLKRPQLLVQRTKTFYGAAPASLT